MSILAEIKNIKGSVRDLRNFGIVVGAMFLVLGSAFLYFGKLSATAFMVVGGLLLAFGLFVPRTLRPLYKVWMAFGVMMGFLVTSLILTIFFYIVLTPLALILKAFGKHFLDLGLRTNQKTYWNHRSAVVRAKSDLEKQF